MTRTPRPRLARHLRLDAGDGRIDLLGQRMLLFHGSSVGALRRELIERLGLERTRELLTRLGYQQGTVDGERTPRLTGGDVAAALRLGPPLRQMEGFVRNDPIGSYDEALRLDPATGRFFGDFHWSASWEAEAHLEHVGVSGVPACWLMIGYASGYSTALMGRPILWREQECAAMGHARCRVVGRPLEEWSDAEDDLRFLRIESFVTTPRSRRVADDGAVAARARGSSFGELVGASRAFNAVVQMLRRVGDTDATVLFLGESGVGKELFARTLHGIGPRAGKPLVTVNCAAIPPELVEAELFGVEKGAFTGAIASRPGRFERADGGTLFLDEISSLPLPAQGRLLRALQEGEIERVGDTRVRHVDVRIVAAANRDLRTEVDAGRFREDLFYRLNVFPIQLPPLRERRDDVPLLADLFLDRYARRFGKGLRGFTLAAGRRLRDADWPGNVRELENKIERAVILADEGGSIDVQHLFHGEERASPIAGDAPLEVLLDRLIDATGSLAEIEARLLDRALARTRGNASAAARMLGLRRGQAEYRFRIRARHARPRRSSS